jgi:GNAT acetyltransferase-like protein
MTLRLEPLDEGQAARWDELVEGSAFRQVFHRRAWLDYLAASRGADIKLWSLRDGGTTRGYFCGGVIQKGPFRILGSPLRGWGTNFMGPVSAEPIDDAALLGALDEAAREGRWDMTELEYPGQDAETFRASGYEGEEGLTYIVRLTPFDERACWERIHPKKRNQIRKAIKCGLTVEDTDDPAIADEFYARFEDLMRRKGRVPPYPPAHPRLLFRHLKPAGMLLSLRVRDASGNILATGLFPHGDRTLYFWGGSSWQDGRDLNPNDFLQWSAIRLGCERGLTAYNMCGPGRFKRGFGGELLELRRWHKCYSRPARWARRGYQMYFNARIRLAARFTRPHTFTPAEVA